MVRRVLTHITAPISVAPLITFRVLFGFIMLVSIIRFAMHGWIYELYVEPAYFFTYYGFSWVKPLGEGGMYALFGLIGLSACCIMIGWRYRLATAVFFVAFTYVELIDKTNYLNHYYFVSIIAFLLLFVPANSRFSVDVLLQPGIRRHKVTAWAINVFKLQLGLVYFFAGLAKVNPDWLFEAMPLRLWLPAFAHIPLLGPVLQLPETAYAFSWSGMLYDLTIVFFLMVARTRIWAYMAVVAFHLMTALLFQIGMFPYIMILSTLIFFSDKFHERCLAKAGGFLRMLKLSVTGMHQHISGTHGGHRAKHDAVQGITLSSISGVAIAFVLTLHFSLQVLLPFRYVLYPADLFWSEQGYRFSWRVMLMEKAGYTVFKVHDPATSKSWEVANWEYLTPNQEKMMATQPDMILQFAHFLEDEYEHQGIEDVRISVDSYVTLNGHRSRRFIDPDIDLTQERMGLKHKDWILPFETQ